LYEINCFNVKLADGTHPFFKTLTSAKRPVVVVGSECLQREDGAAVLANVQKLAQNVRTSIDGGENWRVLNVLHRVASQVNKEVTKVII